MATAVVLPKLGNSVESCLIQRWHKQVGDAISSGETICEIETDKAVMDVESSVDGIVLALFFAQGDDVPVMTNIAVVGQAGESIDEFRPAGSAQPALPAAPVAPQPIQPDSPAVSVSAAPAEVFISPRARTLAAEKSLPYISIQGTGPEGRIIERDIQAALAQRPALTRTALASTADAQPLPATGSGIGGRITAADLEQAPLVAVPAVSPAASSADYNEIRVAGARKVIAQRMLESLQTTAQLTLNTSVNAEPLLAFRKRLKASAAPLGLQSVTINDLLLFAVSRTLLRFPDLNALFLGDVIRQYRPVHLGFAVDTPRGLLVPVIAHADQLSLKALAEEAHRLADACQQGKIKPDELQGGTFSVSNLGSLGIESFTPVLNPPQVAILGVGNINLKPVQGASGVEFVQHLSLSLTVNHQAVDGAPGARFLESLRASLQEIDLLLAV